MIACGGVKRIKDGACAQLVDIVTSTAAQRPAMPGIIPYQWHVRTLDKDSKVIVVPVNGYGLLAYLCIGWARFKVDIVNASHSKPSTE